MDLLRLRNLSVRYARAQQPALNDVSLDVASGTRIGIIGESGSGKSTLAQAVAGILPRSAHVSGKIEWPGLTSPPVSGRDVGMVFQDPSTSLDPVMAVGAQIAEVAYTHLGLTWRQAHARSVELIGKMQLPNPEQLASAYPHQLSGGQRQRIAIAAAIAAEPKLLIADEATSALDTIVQADIVKLLDGLVRNSGMTLIFISHDIALASQLVDRIAVFLNATLVEVGDTDAILRKPKTRYTRTLIEAHLGIEA